MASAKRPLSPPNGQHRDLNLPSSLQLLFIVNPVEESSSSIILTKCMDFLLIAVGFSILFYCCWIKVFSRSPRGQGVFQKYPTILICSDHPLRKWFRLCKGQSMSGFQSGLDISKALNIDAVGTMSTTTTFEGFSGISNAVRYATRALRSWPNGEFLIT